MIESDEPNLCAESDRASAPYRNLARRPSKFKKPAGFRLAGLFDYLAPTYSRGTLRSDYHRRWWA